MKNSTTKTLAWTLAIITCPCNLLILALVLAGTAAGTLITNYFVPLLVILSVLFVISLLKALRT